MFQPSESWCPPMGTPEMLWYGSVFARDSPTISADTSAERRWVLMGFFEDRSREAYDRAAHAVQNGTASPEQRAMNARAAKTAGSLGNKARAAEQGRLKNDKKGWF